MLPGFLSTALEIIIILNICGAVVYFTITGLTRKNGGPSQQSASHPLQVEPTPALAYEGLTTQPVTVPERISPSVYAPTAPEATPVAKTSWTEGLKSQFTGLKERFSYKQTEQTIKKQAITPDYNRLDRVLDSFKEDA